MPKVEIKVYAARFLNVNGEGIFDPSCKLTVASITSVISSPKSAQPKKKFANPVWDQTLLFEVVDPQNGFLHVQVVDTEDNGKETQIGDVWVPLLGITQGEESVKWYQLHHTTSGEIKLGIKPFDYQPPPMPQLQPQVSSSAPSSRAPPGYPPVGYPPVGYPPGSLGSHPSHPPSSPSVPKGSSSLPGLPSASSGYQPLSRSDPNLPSGQNVPTKSYPPPPSPSLPHQQYSSSPAQKPVQQPTPVQPSAPQPPSQPAQSLQQRSHSTSDNPNSLSRAESVGPFQQKPQQPTPQKPRHQLVAYNPHDLQRDYPHLAKGSYGIVFKGKVTGISVPVVIKDMEIRDAKSVNDWKKELQVMNAVAQSPYIADVYGYCSYGNTLTIVMEYMPKGDLYNLLYKKKEPLSTLQRMRMARHCAHGLSYLHTNHFLHRDIKSMNILITDDYSCKLTDFGCAKLVSDRQIFNTVNSGTPLWMAPEVKRGQYSFPADVYSLGLVLFELFEKQLPNYDQLRQTVVLPPSFQSASVVMPCLSPVPEQRPTAAHVAQVLDKMIMNVVSSVKKLLPQEEQEKLKQQAGNKPAVDGDNQQNDDTLDNEVVQLYRHLLHRPAHEVDALIAKAYNISGSSSQHPQHHYNPGHSSPQLPHHQVHGSYGQPHGYPPGMSGIPTGIPAGMPPTGYPIGIPTGIPSGIPSGIPQAGTGQGYPMAPTWM